MESSLALIHCPYRCPRTQGPSQPPMFTSACSMIEQEPRHSSTGVLAATAALAGARHVYAIEQNRNFAALAREFFSATILPTRLQSLKEALTLQAYRKRPVFW
jgi:hypothetical protein